MAALLPALRLRRCGQQWNRSSWPSLRRKRMRILSGFELGASDPLFYPAKPPAHWLMRADVSGRYLSCRSHRRQPVIIGAAVRSAAMKPRPHWPTDAGVTDDQEDVDDARWGSNYHAQPDNQALQGPARRRQPRLSEVVPVRFTPELLDQIRRRAEADDRSLSSWIRRAAEHGLGNSA